MRTYYFYLLTFSASIGSLLFGTFYSGYNLVIFNIISSEIQSFSYIFAICPIFAVLGCYIGCSFSNYYGRKPAIIIMDLLYITGNLSSLSLLYLDHTKIYSSFKDISLFSLLLFGRALCGIAVGFSSFIVPLYIRELAPIEIYARLGSINQFMITIGILFSYMIGYFASGKNWFMVALFIFPVCFSICQIILFTKFFYEDTPTFLLMKNRKKSVISMISRIYYGRDADDSNESFEDKLVTGIMPVSYSSLLRSWTSDSAFRNGCILAGLQQLSGVNYFIVTSASIFPKDQKRITLLLGIVNCISSIFTVLLLKKNYKKNLMYGSFGMAFCYFSILGLLLFENNTVFIYGYFVTALGFTLFFELSIGPILWIYCADILGTKGIAITSSINWICASFIIGVFGLLGANGEVKYHVNEGFSKQISFFCYNLFTLLVCLTVKFYVDCLLCQV